MLREVGSIGIQLPECADCIAPKATKSLIDPDDPCLGILFSYALFLTLLEQKGASWGDLVQGEKIGILWNLGEHAKLAQYCDFCLGIYRWNLRGAVSRAGPTKKGRPQIDTSQIGTRPGSEKSVKLTCCWWKKSCTSWNGNYTSCSKGLIYLNWCRISSINNSSWEWVVGILVSFWGPAYFQSFCGSFQGVFFPSVKIAGWNIPMFNWKYIFKLGAFSSQLS